MPSLYQITLFTDDAAGLEKLLRLFQALSTILSGLALSATDAAFWAHLRGQFNLGRRYFRLLKWYPAWSNALQSISDTSQRGTVCTTLDVAKWSFLGLYFWLEMFTISNAMGATTFEWGPRVQSEANKCWFYALVFSILVSMYELWFLRPVDHPQPPPKIESDNMDGAVDDEASQEDATPAEKMSSLKAVYGSTNGSTTKTRRNQDKDKSPPSPIDRSASSTKLYTQVIIDSCDLFIPGSSEGWIPVGLVFVGTATTISTLLAGRQIWQRVQSSAK